MRLELYASFEANENTLGNKIAQVVADAEKRFNAKLSVTAISTVPRHPTKEEKEIKKKRLELAIKENPELAKNPPKLENDNILVTTVMVDVTPWWKRMLKRRKTK